MDVADATKTYMAWEAFAAKGQPDQLAMATDFVAASPQGMVNLSFSGNWYGTVEEARSVLAPLVKSLGNGTTLTTTPLGWIAGLVEVAGNGNSLDTSKPDGNDTFFTKSIVTTKPFGKSSVTSFIQYLASNGSTSDTAWFVQVDLYGGNSTINRTPADFNAFAHRNAFMVWQFYASKNASATSYPADGIPFVSGMVQKLAPNPEGAYPNYIDPTLAEGVWEALYFDGHTDRLRSVKASVDRTDVFKLVEGF